MGGLGLLGGCRYQGARMPTCPPMFVYLGEPTRSRCLLPARAEPRAAAGRGPNADVFSRFGHLLPKLLRRDFYEQAPDWRPRPGWYRCSVAVCVAVPGTDRSNVVNYRKDRERRPRARRFVAVSCRERICRTWWNWNCRKEKGEGEKGRKRKRRRKRKRGKRKRGGGRVLVVSRCR